MPRPVWVRSLVPKLKNSARLRRSRRRSARRAAPRSSCRPGNLSLTFFSACTSLATRSTISACRSNSFLNPTSGIMTSGTDLDAFLLDDRRGLEHRARLHLGDLREVDPEAAAAEAEHRVELVELLDALQWIFSAGMPSFFAEIRLLFLACAAGTRAAADRGSGSSPGSPCSARKMPAEVVALVAAAAWRAPPSAPRALSARIISRMASMRSPSKNMCSVRHRPMPTAPKAMRVLRLLRRVGVGAHRHAASPGRTTSSAAGSS